MQRYCCEILKENTTPDRLVSTGVRWDESTKRSKRGQLEAAAPKVENRITLMNDNDDKRLVIERCAILSLIHIFEIDAIVTLKVPVQFAGKRLPEMKIRLKVQAGYIEVF